MSAVERLINAAHDFDNVLEFGGFKLSDASDATAVLLLGVVGTVGYSDNSGTVADFAG